jgi:hypothetical protein
MPTGSGKSGLATALPYVAQSHRTLVLVPSVALRKQLASGFASEEVLRAVGAIRGDGRPKVTELTHRRPDWAALEAADVVVCTPNALHGLEGVDAPSVDFFDLVIVDEAHHAPAATWRAVVEHFAEARTVFLTATPKRRDGKTVSGVHAYHYSLKQAMRDGIYKPIKPVLVEVTAGESREEYDLSIAQQTAQIAALEEHRSSAILIRTSTIARAETLKAIYESLGMSAVVVHSRVNAAKLRHSIEEWKIGRLRTLIAVDMLGEGVDIPRLRIVAYHDKHKSVPATAQFIGRLARTSSDFPQDSVLVTARDADNYPALITALRALYAEDTDWAILLPELIDADIENEKLDNEFADAYEDTPSVCNASNLTPLARSIIYEAPNEYVWPFHQHAIPAELHAGSLLGAQTILYSGLSHDNTLLIVITSRLETPKWYQNDPSLTRPVYDLHIAAWRPTKNTDRRNLILLNSKDKRMMRAMREVLDPDGVYRNGNPSHLQGAFDSLERLSVSSVGVRNTFAGTAGRPAYAMFAGKSIERGLTDNDTGTRALGHVMAQVQINDGTTTVAGMASSKSKYWETRYLSLRLFDAFAHELAGRYWFPQDSRSGPLLPNVARGSRTETFGTGEPWMSEFSPRIYTQGWRIPELGPIEDMDLEAALTGASDRIALTLRNPLDDSILWSGTQDTQGLVTAAGDDLELNRGPGLLKLLSELLMDHPASIYFLDGKVIAGGMTYTPPQTEHYLPDIKYTSSWDWSATDIHKESQVAGRTDTVHDLVEHKYSRPVDPATLRWVLRNDGKGEIADHLILEVPFGVAGRPRLNLVHSKFANNNQTSVRVVDMEVVTQQAAKSRRYITDRDLWGRLARRLTGAESPKLHIVSGASEELLLAVLGVEPRDGVPNLTESTHAIDGTVTIVQPGLSISQLRQQLAAEPVPISAAQVREFLVLAHNALEGLAALELVSGV